MSRILPSGHEAEVVALTYGRGRINVYDGLFVLDCW
jgi:hypothetical protein